MAKLVEILARELEEWPDDVTWIAQDNYYGPRLCGFVNEKPMFKDINGSPTPVSRYGNRWTCQVNELAEDYTSAIATREMWEQERNKLIESKQGMMEKIYEEWKHPVYVDWGDGWDNFRSKINIRHIRDRIYQIREQIASLETEQKNLIEILDKEGFILKDFSAESPIPEGVDVNDWRTWKVGDLVEMLRPWNGLEEGIHSILEIEPASYEGKVPVRVGGSDKKVWPVLENLRWHSRPTG